MTLTYSSSSIANKRPADNYSRCPLKKRPIKYDWNDSSSDTENLNTDVSERHENLEPENLSTKPEDLRLQMHQTCKNEPKEYSPVSSPSSSPPCYYEQQHYFPGPLEPAYHNINTATNFHPYYLTSVIQQSQSASRHPQSILKTSFSEDKYFQQPENFTELRQTQYWNPVTEGVPLEIREHHLNSTFGRINRTRSLSSGSLSDRSSPTLSDTLSPISTTSSSAARPTNVNGRTRYQCPDCSKSYSTYSGLTKHIQFHCSSQHTKTFSCQYCEKVYNSVGALKMHIRTHTLPCKCTICGKAFSRPWLLQGHIRTHTGEKPFSCEYCHRAFADRSNLRAHLQTHTEVKKYSCQSCSKTFSRTSLLIKHQETGCCGTLGC